MTHTRHTTTSRYTTCRRKKTDILVGLGTTNFLSFLKILVLVERIISEKRKECSFDTTTLESEIDRLVYQLYGLTEEEIRIVEGKE